MKNKYMKKVNKMTRTSCERWRERHMMFFVFILLFSCVLIQNVSAIGITPGRTTINFEPGLEKKVTFSVINSENKEMNIAIEVQGELKEYITLSDKQAKFSADEDSKSFTYLVKLPENIKKPGLYQAEIIVTDLPEGVTLENKGETFIETVLSVVTQLHVHVSPEQNYLEAKLNIIKDQDKNIFQIDLENKGTSDVGDVQAEIEIYDLSGKKVKTLTTETKSLPVREKTQITAEWIPDGESGPHKAKTTINYDGETIQLENDFYVGEMVVEIEKIRVKDFKLGEIAKFDITARNSWSTELKEVYIQMDVYDSNGKIFEKIKTPEYDMPALGRVEMVSYWDTEDVKPGLYDGKFHLSYNGNSVTRDIQIKVEEYSIEVIGITGMVVRADRREGFNTQSILIFLVIILVIGNITWFVVVRRMRKKKK